MAVFHRVYKWVANMPDYDEVPVPMDIRDELLGAALLLGRRL